MSMHSTPEEHASDPPSAWTVERAATRVWRLCSSLGHTIDVFSARRDALSAKTSGRWVALYEREGRWFAGQPVAGWRPYTATDTTGGNHR